MGGEMKKVTFKIKTLAEEKMMNERKKAIHAMLKTIANKNCLVNDEIDSDEFDLPKDFQDENVESKDDDRPTRTTPAFEDPESEFNPTRDVLEDESLFTLDNYLASLRGEPGYSQLCKMIFRMPPDDLTDAK